MTHSLINNKGTVINLTSGQVEKLDKITQSKFRAMVDFGKFLGSDIPKVIDTVEPSNTTLVYLSILLANSVYYNDKLGYHQIDESNVNRVVITTSSIKTYINAANQLLERVDSSSPNYAYSDNCGIVSKPELKDDLITRLQVILEPILFKEINGRPLDVVVNQDFDVPYALNCFANVVVWTPEQYAVYENLKNETDKAKAESNS